MAEQQSPKLKAVGSIPASVAKPLAQQIKRTVERLDVHNLFIEELGHRVEALEKRRR